MTINILYQSPWSIGGSTSFTVHLAKVLGAHAQIVRIAKRTEPNVRPLGDFGVTYHNMSIDDIVRLRGPLLLTASNPKQDETHWERLAKRKDMWAVFHDPNEFKLYPHWQYFDASRVICIRETGLDHMRRGRFIPHPYVRYPDLIGAKRTQHAISIARVSAVKQSDIIIEANMALKPERQCVFHGEWNRMWYAHTVRKKYPHVQLTKSYPRMDGHAVELCRTARYMVDLTKFDNDGGGTQYSFLEAMDGGAVPVMSAAWVSYPGAAMRFGPAVRTARDLAALLAKPVDEEKLAKQRERNEHYLRTVHDPKTICEQYLHTLQP